MTQNTETARRLLLERVREGRLDPTVAAQLLARAGRSGETASETVGYVPVWEPAPYRQLTADPLRAQDVLLVLDGDTSHRAGSPMESELARVGQDLTGDRASWISYLDELRARGSGPRGLVFDLSSAHPRRAVELVLPALQALVAGREAAAMPVAFLIAGDAHAQLAAVLGGFAQVASGEDRRLRAVAVWVDQSERAGRDGEPFRLALAELSAARPGLAQVRHSAAGREVRTLRAASVARAGRQAFRDGGRYLITGGGGGVGLRLAAVLARDHRARLVLTGRSEPSVAQLAEFRGLQDDGAKVIYVRGDVTRYEDVLEAVGVAQREFGGLDGVLHSAGLNEDAYLANKDVESALRVLSVKLDGATHLDRATSDLPLDFFVLFSSTSAYFGAAGQADYAAGNRALGAFTAERAHRVTDGSRRGTSVAVAWPLWADGGMDVSAENRLVLEQAQGMVPMPTSAGLEALADAISVGDAERLVVYGHQERVDAWITKVCAEEPTTSADSAPASESDDEGLVAAAEGYLLDLVTDAAKLPAGRLRPDQEFSTLGVDSILIKKLTASLEDRLGELPVTLFFEYRTVGELSRYLAARHTGALREVVGLGEPVDSGGAQREEHHRQASEVTVPRTELTLNEPSRELEGGLPHDQAVAIVGVGGRYPGGPDLTRFWEALSAGEDLVGEIPTDRWDNDRYLADRRGAPGAITGRWGGFLDDVARFDPLFFGIAPSEAAKLDPHERIFLEVAWSALEHAGYSRRKLHEATRVQDTHSVGVFVGVTGSQYGLVGAEQWGRGNRVFAHSMDYSIANRLSYVLDVHGPSMVLDTACSGSLTALHLACRSLLSGETRMAVSGGVNVNIHPIKYATLTDMRLLASDGRCRAFGTGGDGFVPGEGAGALILKRLSDALADGDRVHAVIRGTAVNHGGRSNGYTVPTPRAQRAVVADALRTARLDARAVSYVEAHGTGTALGDPVEIEGLKRAFAEHTGDTGFCAIGSVKSNIGHLEAAAGVCGVTKVVLQFAHRTLVPTLHSEPLNPKLDLDSTPFYPQRATESWPARDGAPRRACVSSFGAGGANGHVVLEEWPTPDPPPHASPHDRRPYVVGLSARVPDQLRQVARRLVAELSRGTDHSLRDIAYTLVTGREEWDHRLTVVATSVAGLRASLTAYLDGDAPEEVRTGRAGQAEPRADVRELLAAGRWEELAEAWVEGARVPWADAFGDGPRPLPVPLPAYPFGGKRYWVDLVDAPAELATEPANPGALRRTDDVVADHTVGGRPLVAGVVQLALARAAAPLPAEPVVVEDVNWLRPLEVTDETLKVAVTFDESGSYEVRAAATDSVHSTGTLRAGVGEPLGRLNIDAVRRRCPHPVGADIVYGRAEQAGLSYGPLFRGLTALYRGEGESLAELTPPVSDAPEWAVEAAMTDSALHAVQGVLPEDETRTALPAGAARVTFNGSARHARYAHVQLVTLDTPRRTAQANVTLADAGGDVLVRFEGLRIAFRAGKPQEPSTPPEQAVPLYRPVWRAAPLDSTPATPHHSQADHQADPDDEHTASSAVLVIGKRRDHGLGAALRELHQAAGSPVEHVLLEDVPSSSDGFGQLLDRPGAVPETVWFLGGVEERLYAADDLDQLSRSMDEGPVALFHLLKALDQRREHTRRRGVRLHVVTSGVQQTDEGTAARNPFAGGLSGLVTSASREMTFLSLSCVDIAREDLVRAARLGEWGALVGQLSAEPAARPAHPVALSDGVRYARRLEHVDLSGMAEHAPLREGGRYLVTGGAGGLGTVVGAHLAREYGARVLLVGRRRQEHLPRHVRELLSAEPEHLAYATADVTDESALGAAVGRMRREWGGVDGVIHAAFVLNDRTLSSMDESTLRSSFGPKAQGTVVLQRVLAGEPLDFFALFSSAISHSGNAGQANYASASTFQDAYGRFLATRLRTPVKVLNWGLWGESGSVATDEYRTRISSRLGVEPISDAEGLTAFVEALAAPAVELAPVRVSAAPDEPRVRPVTALRTASEAVRMAASAACRHTPEDPQLVGAGYFAALETYARRLLRDKLLAAGMLPPPGGSCTMEGLATRLDVPHTQQRMLAAALFALERGGHLVREQDGTLSVPPQEPRVPDPAGTRAARHALLEAYPHAAALTDLLRECAEALPDVLRGHRDGLSVLFPGGDDRKVAPLYHDDPRSELFNARCAHAVAAYTGRRREESAQRLRLLEIGAGTGGTTRPVLDALRGYGDTVDYTFTDLSPALVRKARERLPRTAPHVDFSVLDIAQDPAQQGFADGSYDVVLAANVLHATTDVRHAVRAAARLLRPGGLLLVNEGTRVLDAVTMIFGLTEGWWAYDDAELRQPHSPLLAPGTWRSLLLDSGLQGVRVVGAPGPDDTTAGQHLLLAERDVWPLPRRRTDGFVPESAEHATRPATARPLTPRPSRTEPTAHLTQAALTYLRGVFASVLKLEEDELAPDVPLSAYGTDSLVGMEAADRIETDLGSAPRDLPFESTSLNALAEALLRSAAEPFARFVNLPPLDTRVPAGPCEPDPSELATAYLTRLFADLLKLAEDELDPGVPLSAYGVDSLVSMEAADRIEAELGPVAHTVPFASTSLHGVVKSLMDEPSRPLDRLGDQTAPAVSPKQSAPVVPSPPASAVAELAAGPDTALGDAVRQEPVAAVVAQPPVEAAGDNEPVALVGFSARFPGADSLDALWEHLREGRRATTEVPATRWSSAAAPGTARWGAFLNDVESFDPLLFRMSPRDAERTDPQERLFLEAVWAALEDAGTTRARLEQSARTLADTGVGVFAGLMHNPYQVVAAELRGAGRAAQAHSAHWSVANRTSYTFGFTGASMAVDTACSSALTALHLACEAIRRGDCGAAVAGGVNLLLEPSHHADLAAMKMLSPDGRCRPFGREANGMVPGEGVGAAVLKPLSAALRDGDRIHGVLLGSAVNANGATDSIVTPSAQAQEELIRRALARAGVRPDSVRYVEAQATGSPIADPVEAEALARVFGRGVAVGSVKPSLGHLEAASGMGQLAKVLVQLRHGELAATLDCAQPVAALDGGTALRLVRERQAWPDDDTAAQRVAAISSFGAGGANAHLVVSGPPTPTRPTLLEGPRLVLLSARREEQLRSLTRRLADHLANLGDDAPPLTDVARTLAAGREPLSRRLAVVAHDVSELVSVLRLHLSGQEDDRVRSGRATTGSDSVHQAASVTDTAALAEAGTAWAAGARLSGFEQALGFRDGLLVSLPHYPFVRTVHRLPSAPTPPPPTGAVQATGGPSRAHPSALLTSTEAATAAVPVPQRSPHSPDSEENDVSNTTGPPEPHDFEGTRVIVVDLVADVLGVLPDDINQDEHLSDYGFDSITVVELTNRVNATLDTTLNPADMYGFRDIAALVRALAEETSQAPAHTTSERTPPATGQIGLHQPTGDHDQTRTAAASAPVPALTEAPKSPAQGEGEEPVAIVGMAGAFPGSPDLASYWGNLLAGRDLVGEIPTERFDWREIYGDPVNDPGKVPSRWGGFLAGVDEFDPEFFRISPREAKLMDPQHRLFLRTAWQAIEDAGHDPTSMAGSDTGVFVGCGSTEYATLLLDSDTEIDGQLATGNAHSMLANRVSFLLDLRGPSEPVDTACSSGLVAVHRAVRALQDGECSAALAGGVNLTLTPTGYLAFGKSGMLAADGRCKTFDHRADGYVRGEGVGAVLLKPLSTALLEGDTIYAVVRGTAVNHGGRAASLTAPNSASQAAVITAAHRRGGTDASLVGYVEAHGTGTALGDPVEVKGLTQAFRELGVPSEQRQFTALGSVKTNIGHLETAAGIAGLIKTVLALRERMLPPTLHLEQPNPHLDLADSPFYLVDSARPWDPPRSGEGTQPRRLAGVSSFGFGGVNAHVVVEEFPDTRPVEQASAGPQIYVLSARTDAQLREYAVRLADHLDRSTSRGRAPAETLACARTLQSGRPSLERRLAVVTDSLNELTSSLRSFGAGRNADGAVFTTPVVTDRLAGGLLEDDDRARVLELAKRGDLTKAAALWVRGAPLDWEALHGRRRPRRIAGLPTYPFARERHWLPSVSTRATQGPTTNPPTATAATAATASVGTTVPADPRTVTDAVGPASSAPAAPGPVPPPAASATTPALVTTPTSASAPAANGPTPASGGVASPPSAPVPRTPSAAGSPYETTQAAATQAPHGAVPGSQLTDQVRTLLAEGIGLAPEAVDAERDLTAYGVDSISALRIMQRIQAAFGDHIPMAAIFECTTLNSLVRHLVEEYDVNAAGSSPSQSAEAPPGLPTRPGSLTPTTPEAVVLPFGGDGPGVPLHALPGATGELTWLLHLRTWFAAEGPVRGVEFVSTAPSGPTDGHGLNELAAACARAVLADRPQGPVRLAGYSIAAHLAVETARQLTDAGHEVSELVLLDAPEPLADHTENGVDDVRAVAEHFAAVWSGSPLTAAGAWDDRESALRSAAESLSTIPEVPLGGADLAARLDWAAGWRRVLRQAVAGTVPRPLALPCPTRVLAPQQTTYWDRALVPPPALLGPVAAPCGAASPSGATELAARDAEVRREPTRREPLEITDREIRTAPPEGREFVVPINRSGEGTPSFWVHHLFGDVSYCIYLSRYLGMDHPLYGLEQLDSELRFTEFPSIEAMAERYVTEIRQQHPEGPYVLGGASFGGILAFEMARQLTEAGQEVSRLYLVDALLPGTGAWSGVDNTVITEENQDAVTLMLIGNSASQLWRADPTLSVDELSGMAPEEAIDHVTRHIVEGSPAELSADEVHRLVRTRFALLDLNGKLLLDYEARPFARPVPTTVFHATKGFSAAENPYGMPAIGRDDSDTTNGLGTFAGDDVTVHDLDADHFTIVLEDNLRAIAKVVAQTLPALVPNGVRS